MANVQTSIPTSPFKNWLNQATGGAPGAINTVNKAIQSSVAKPATAQPAGQQTLQSATLPSQYNTPGGMSKASQPTGLMNKYQGTSNEAGDAAVKSVLSGFNKPPTSPSLPPATTPATPPATAATPPATPTVTPPATPLQSTYQGFSGIGAGTSGAAANTPLYQSWLNQQANNPTPAAQSIQGLQGIAQNLTPEVKAAQDQYAQFAKASPFMQSNVSNNPNVASEVSFGRGQALGQTLSGVQQALASNVANALQGSGQQITAGQSAGQLGLQGQQQQIGAQEAGAGLGLTQQGQQISALTGAGGLAGLKQQGYTFFDPITQQWVNPGGAEGGAFMGGQVNTRETQGGTYQANKATMTAADQIAGSLPSLIKQSGSSPTDVNVLNSLFNAFSTNTSGQYPLVQAAFNNAIAQYAKILGTQRINALLPSAKGSTIESFFNTLKSEAEAVQKGLSTPGAQSQKTDAEPTGTTGKVMFGSFF